MNFVLSFRMANRYDGRTKKAGGIKTLLAIVLKGIFYLESRTVKYLFSVRTIKLVLFEVDCLLGGLPRKFHRQVSCIRLYILQVIARSITGKYRVLVSNALNRAIVSLHLGLMK